MTTANPFLHYVDHPSGTTEVYYKNEWIHTYFDPTRKPTGSGDVHFSVQRASVYFELETDDDCLSILAVSPKHLHYSRTSADGWVLEERMAVWRLGRLVWDEEPPKRSVVPRESVTNRWGRPLHRLQYVDQPDGTTQVVYRGQVLQLFQPDPHRNIDCQPTFFTCADPGSGTHVIIDSRERVHIMSFAVTGSDLDHKVGKWRFGRMRWENR